MSRQPGKHALAFIFMTVLIDTIGFGIIMPVMPQLIVQLTGQPMAGASDGANSRSASSGAVSRGRSGRSRSQGMRPVSSGSDSAQARKVSGSGRLSAGPARRRPATSSDWRRSRSGASSRTASCRARAASGVTSGAAPRPSARHSAASPWRVQVASHSSASDAEPARSRSVP